MYLKFTDRSIMIQKSRGNCLLMPTHGFIILDNERLMGVKPTSLAWKASIIIVIRQPHLLIQQIKVDAIGFEPMFISFIKTIPKVYLTRIH